MACIKKMFSFDLAFVKRVTAMCWPVFLNEFFWVTGVSMYKLVYARMGTQSIAAVNIVATLEEFLFVPFFGIFHAGSILIANSIGAKRYKQAFAYGKFMLLAQLPMALLTQGLCSSCAEGLFWNFTIFPRQLTIIPTT